VDPLPVEQNVAGPDRLETKFGHGTRLTVEILELLGGSSRSQVRRVRAGSRTLIAKEFTATDDGWTRETAALSILPAEVPAPRLVAADPVARTVVMTDLGSGASVADALLGPDPTAATDALVAWATAIGVLHRTTAGLRMAFRDALGQPAGDRPVAESTLVDDLAETADVLGRHGFDVPTRAVDELCGLATRLGDASAMALTPADACPDNNMRTADGLALIDFEGAQWRHVAWDVAYLFVPWPTCWCSWRIPDDVAERALDAYRAACAMPAVTAAGFDHDVEAAVVGWVFMSVALFLPRALLEDAPPGNPAKPGPNRRALILHRLDRASRSRETPALARLAGDLHAVLTARWGALTLAYAPAFSQTSQTGGPPGRSAGRGRSN
jgi:hypothetical protein